MATPTELARGLSVLEALQIGFDPASPTIKKFTKGTIAVDPASIAAGAVGTVSLTLAGVKAGDLVMLVPPSTLEAGLIVKQPPVVEADDTVKLQLFNPTAGAVDGTSKNWMYYWWSLA